MSFGKQMDSVISRYLNHRYNWIPDDIHTWPRWRRVWTWWKAIAEFKLVSLWFNDIKDAPEPAPDGTWISVMTDDALINYERRNGKWVKVQQTTEEECKSIYSD